MVVQEIRGMEDLTSPEGSAAVAARAVNALGRELRKCLSWSDVLEGSSLTA